MAAAGVWLAIADEAADAVVPQAPVSALAQESQRSLANFAVDDDFLVLSNTATMLDNLGHRTPIALPRRGHLGP